MLGLKLLSLDKMVSEKFGASIHNNTKHRSNVNAKYAFCYLARNELGLKYQTIARYLKRNHATIIHYVKNFRGVYKSDTEFKELYNSIDLIVLKKSTILERINFHKEQIKKERKKLKEYDV